MNRVALALLITGATVVASPASAQVIFRMDYSSSTGATGSWQPVEAVPNYTRTRIAGGGPSGQDAFELTQRSVPSLEAYGGQFDWGWDGPVESSDPAQGSRRYYRWRMRFSPTTNFRGLSWGGGGASGVQNKLLIIGQGCGERCRFILTYQAERDSGVVRNFRLQLDGGVDLVDTGSYAVGQWLNIQIELQSGSTASTANGGYKIWINNNNYAAPTAQRTGITLRPANWRSVAFGGYMNDGLDSTGVHTYRQTDFQVASAFDSVWGSGGSGGGGGTPTTPLSAPSNVRIIVP
jgi:hypothetical protein